MKTVDRVKRKDILETDFLGIFKNTSDPLTKFESFHNFCVVCKLKSYVKVKMT